MYHAMWNLSFFEKLTSDTTFKSKANAIGTSDFSEVSDVTNQLRFR